MPTTRRGRYLFYKKRARRRYFQNEKKRYKPGVKARRTTARKREVHLWGKQVSLTIPLKPRNAPNTFDWTTQFWMVKPDYALFGVRPRNPLDGLPYWANAHQQEARVGYQVRRVLSIPRLHSAPWQPYKFALVDVPPSRFYPHEFYPSGQRSYYWRTYVD